MMWNKGGVKTFWFEGDRYELTLSPSLQPERLVLRREVWSGGSMSKRLARIIQLGMTDLDAERPDFDTPYTAQRG